MMAVVQTIYGYVLLENTNNLVLHLRKKNNLRRLRLRRTELDWRLQGFHSPSNQRDIRDLLNFTRLWYFRLFIIMSPAHQSRESLYYMGWGQCDNLQIHIPNIRDASKWAPTRLPCHLSKLNVARGPSFVLVWHLLHQGAFCAKHSIPGNFQAGGISEGLPLGENYTEPLAEWWIENLWRPSPSIL